MLGLPPAENQRLAGNRAADARPGIEPLRPRPPSPKLAAFSGLRTLPLAVQLTASSPTF